MSYSTSEKLQYAVTRAQESAGARPHLPVKKTSKIGFFCDSCDARASSVSARHHQRDVDSLRVAHRMMLSAARKGRHVSFPGCCSKARMSRDALSLHPIGPCHDSERDDVSSPSVACIRPHRPCLRARRGRLAVWHRRRALSRFHLGRRGELARPRASASRGRAAGAGDQAVAHVEPVQEPGRRAPGRTAVRAELRGHGVLLQLRRGGDGVFDQGRAPLSRVQRSSREIPHRHLRGRVPRPDVGHARRHGVCEIP